MASFTDLSIPSTDWVELYTQTGLSAGEALVLQNKGSSDILVYIADIKPASDSTDGFLMLDYTSKDSMAHSIPAGYNSVWLKTAPSGRTVSGKVSIQTLTAILPTVNIEHPALSSLSDAFDPTSNVKSKVMFTDEADRVGMVSMTGEMHVGFKMDDVSVNFQYGISPRDVIDGGTSTGTGSVGTFKSTATVSTGTGVGSASLQSVDAVRYRAGHESNTALSVVFGTPEVNVNQYAGFQNSQDGWSVGYNGLDFGLWFIEGTNVNFIPQSTWNLDRIDGSGVVNDSGYHINPQTGQLYRLSFTWHGFLDLVLEVRTDKGRWIPCHKEVFVNSAIETHLENPNLPVMVKVERTSGTGSDITVKTGSWRAGVIAGVEERNNSDRWFAYTRLDATIANDNNNVFAITNKATYQGKPNHISLELGVVTFVSDLNKTVAVYGNSGGVITGGTDIGDVDSTSSVVSIVQGGTVEGGSRGPATIIRAGGDRRTDVRDTGIILHPGQTFIFEVVPGAAVNGTFSLSARWREFH